MSQKYQFTTWAAITLMTAMSVTGCGGGPSNTTTYDQSPRYQQQVPQQKKGLSAGRKMILVAGAAALYYMLKKNQEQRQQGQSVPQYYLSKNGGVYYRDANKGVHWVKPPSGGISVPESEAQTYNIQQFQGYQGRNDGKGLAGLNPTNFY